MTSEPPPNAIKNSRHRRLRLYGPSLTMLFVLIPFFSYYTKQVKIEEGYQNDRAFRMLDLIARQFGAEIDGAHNAMDAALKIPGQESNLWCSEKTDCPKEDGLKAIIGYIDTYVPDKYKPENEDGPIPVRQQNGLDVHEVVFDSKAKAATTYHFHSIEQFEDSRTFIELQHEGEIQDQKRETKPVKIRIFLDPSKMLAHTLENDRNALFDTVFVASMDEKGTVLAQKSNPQVNVVHVETLLKSGRLHDSVEGSTAAKSTDDGKPAASTALPGAVSGANEKFNVQVSGTDYVLFIVPAPFSLDDHTQPMEANSKPMAFYGLVRKSALEKQALLLPDLALPGILLLLFVCFAFLWPALKLFTMSDRERLKKGSVVNICAISIVASVFVAAIALSLGFYLSLEEIECRNLKTLATKTQRHLIEELRNGFDTKETLEKLLGEPPKIDPTDKESGRRVSFADLYKDHRAIAEELNERYPFFEHLILSGPGENGSERQLVKLSANALPTPLIPLPSSRFPFIDRLKLNPSNLDRDFVLQSFISPNTGEFLPIVMFDPQNTDHLKQITSLMRITLTTKLPSLVHVVFPRGFGFAVIEPDGTVDFHSEVSRNLKENFFNECQDDDELRRYVRNGEDAWIRLNYGGRPIRAFVTPLGKSNRNLGLSLIVFSRFKEQAHVIGQTGLRAVAVMLGILLLSAVGAALYRLLRWTPLYATTIAYLKTRTWPRAAQKAYYLLECLWCLLCFLIAVAIMLWQSSPCCRLLFIPLLLCFVGFSSAVQKRLHPKRVLGERRLNRWLDYISLSVAYSARIFALMLGLIGILSIFVFQSSVSFTQDDESTKDRFDFAEKLKSRNESIMRDFQARKVGGISRAEFCTQQRKAFDLYDVQQEGEQGPVKSVTNCATPEQLKYPSREMSSALPGVGWRTLTVFYLPGFVTLIGAFIWLNLIIRRLFLLDFRAPQPLFRTNQEKLKQQITVAATGSLKRFGRSLIYAHPQSGTGVAIAEILADLPAYSIKSPQYALIDFSQLAVNECWNQPKFRQAAVEASKANKIVILDNFEMRLTETEIRLAKLALLEAVVYEHCSSVYVFTSSDPLLMVESLLNQDAESQPLQDEMARWIRVMSSFERSIFSNEGPTPSLDKGLMQVKAKLAEPVRGFSETKRQELFDMLKEELTATVFLRRCGEHMDFERIDLKSPRDFEDSLVGLVRQQADGYYAGIWLNCTSDERLAIYQLAKDNWLNPLNKVAIAHLWRKEIIIRKAKGGAQPDDGPYRLMNGSFRAFALRAVTQHELATWKRQQNLSLWPALRMALGMAVVVIAGFVFYVQRDLFDVYFGYFAAIAGGGVALVRMVIQFFSKANPSIGEIVGTGKSGKAPEVA